MKAQNKISPEKYIVTKSRTLEISRCFLIGNTETGKLQVIISRKHKTGNITVGFYLVDLWCLGIKDSFFDFNLTESDFNLLLETMYDAADLTEVDYVKAHNIIYAAYEYALDLGIKQSPVFENTTKYLLEEDNDDIPLIEIECGRNGRPFYEQGIESASEANKIIRTLEKSVGKDGFDYQLLNQNHFETEDLLNGLESMMDIQKKYEAYTLEELQQEYLTFSSEERLNPEQAPFNDAFMVRDALEKFYSSGENYPESWNNILGYTVDNEYITPSLLGNDTAAISEEDDEYFSECIDAITGISDSEPPVIEDFGDALQHIEENYPDLPITQYVRAKLNGNTDWKPLMQNFPEYSIFKLENHFENGNSPEQIDLESVFGNSRNISSYEAFVLLKILLQEIDKNQILEEFISFENLILKMDLFESEASVLMWESDVKKLQVIEKYVTEKIAPRSK
ncbi:hypothetical protein [Chryseobacterium hagamense]|uniref:Uncharacterized protein n=1 Tax=Chryseobacterium hagamense TaxID=395935 RepID=A0A511YK05_9FLAO|nr:hypothetical protein [Chryseobacterium hagamense]GEN75504.1 hypothetical protein CHA01nite_12440 [Chryseobacterium hagamense]